KGHPRDFAFVPNPNNYISVLADTLARGFNIFGGAWVASPGGAMIELVTIDWLRQIMGLPEGAGGIFVSGGSMANLTGLLVARHIKLNDHIDKAVIYLSDQIHASIAKDLRIIGFAPHQIHIIESDENFRLPVEAVRRAIDTDRAAGLRPFMIAASAGTTNTGTADPLNALADVCEAEDLWFHVDGAYGAAAMLSEKGKAELAGLERVHSMAFDPHKWLFQSFEMGCTLVREARWLHDTFTVHAEYLAENEDPTEQEVNFYNMGVQMTRSLRALKLWMSVKYFGMDAFREAVAWGIELAEIAEAALRKSSCWEIISPAHLGVVAFRYVVHGASEAQLDTLNLHIAEAIRADGFAVIFTTTLKGKTALRMSTINPRTTEADIRETIQLLERLGQAAEANSQRKK
ncbi:MAG: aminotransferase class I/II-fold pyridoxal phosphate-dependent enzyme, partial [Chloroflexi bacterium]